VAIFMCVSRVCLRAVNSGNAVMAVFRLAVLEVKSLYNQHLYAPASGKHGHLRDIIHIADPR
jgi:hypothetical protein